MNLNVDFIENSCRICLTTDEDGRFKKIEPKDSLSKQISVVYHVQLGSDSELICDKCINDVEIAWKLFNRINDATDYFEHFKDLQSKDVTFEPDTTAGTQSKQEFIFECDACLKSFKDMKSLNEHIADHNAYACFFCTVTFSSVQDRFFHMKTSHKEELEIIVNHYGN